MQTTLHAFKLSARYKCCLHYGLTLYTNSYKYFNKYQTTSFEFPMLTVVGSHFLN